MRLVNHEPNAIDLRTTPVHLGLGSRAKPVEGFAWDPEVLHAYSAAVAADGAEGRMVTIFDGDGPGDHWERHPAGDELVVCLSGSVTVTRDVDGVPDRVVLGPGEATVNPAGTWHAVDMAGPASILTITAGLGTDRRPRSEARPTDVAGFDQVRHVGVAQALHLRVVGLSHPHAAQSPGRHDWPTISTATGEGPR